MMHAARNIGPAPRARSLGESAVLALLVGFLAVYACGVCLDFISAIRYPYELDYGEGIIWQQAKLIPGPHMYAAGQDLPFIVFHYPPLYHLLVRAAAYFMPDLLSAGRLVSAIATISITPLVAGLVLVAVPPPDGRRRLTQLGIAVAVGLLALCLHAVRTWGMYMRVDMVAIALGLAGVLVAARSDGGLRGTICALLLCLASVYCKQTQLPAGIAVFVVTLVRRPGVAIRAGAVVLAVGLSALALLQWFTAGGFLQNILGDNINRLALHNAVIAVRPEFTSFPCMALMLAAAWIIPRNMVKSMLGSSFRRIEARHRLRSILADRAKAARAMVLLHFVLAGVLLVTVFKSGGYFNYLLDWLCVGLVLIGVLLCDLAYKGRWFSLVIALTAPGLLFQPIRYLPDQFPQSEIDAQDVLVRRIAESDKPVASENMTLLMRAGKSVVYEPAIVTELAAVGRWDEGPLVKMIESRGFAFMITADDWPENMGRRTAAVNAAMRRAYPRMEQVSSALWLHLPPN